MTARGEPVVQLRNAAVAYGARTLWSGLDLDLEPGEFVSVMGPNGTGKSSLLKAILGLVPLAAGTARVAGHGVRRGSTDIGYIPQHRGLDSSVPLRGRDLVRLGIDGNRWGLPSPRRDRQRVADLLARVEATGFADAPVGRLSGGEQQQLRIAQALATEPRLLLCDEPLLSLDLRHQQTVVDVIDRERRERDTAVLFVTHELNPVLPVTDRVLYLTDGAFRLGPPEEVMTSEVLSGLFGSPIEVLRRGDRIIVLGADHDEAHHEHDHGYEDVQEPLVHREVHR